MHFTFATPPRIVCGLGAIATLAQLAPALLGPRILVVTDKGVRACGILDRLEQTLRQTSVTWEVFDTVVADPPDHVVLAAAEQARAFGTTGVIGLGGGSPMDTAKLVALLAASPGAVLAQAYGVNQVQGGRLPLALVPTTAGTGS